MKCARRAFRLPSWGDLWPLTAALAVLLCSVACRPPAPVIQGRVLGLAADGRQVQLADERDPEAPPAAFDISQAEIGNPPQVGDELRIVYRTEGGVNRALRVMNITKQSAIEKGQH